MCINMAPQDIIGRQFEKWSVLSVAGKHNNKWYYECQCRCGNKKRIRRDALLYGSSKSCGSCAFIEKEGDHYRYFCSNGDSFLFDECDLSIAESRQWYIFRKYPMGAFNGIPRKFSVAVMNPAKGEVVDHINGNTRDNRRKNLRNITQGNNTRNRHMAKNNKTGYKGVSLNKRTGKYEVHICINGKDKYLGLYDTAIEAAQIYDNASRQFHGEYGGVNFPQGEEISCFSSI